jgi:hypothetical protein
MGSKIDQNVFLINVSIIKIDLYQAVKMLFLSCQGRIQIMAEISTSFDLSAFAGGDYVCHRYL